jgi:hypothetical protein
MATGFNLGQFVFSFYFQGHANCGQVGVIKASGRREALHHTDYSEAACMKTTW